MPDLPHHEWIRQKIKSRRLQELLSQEPPTQLPGLEDNAEPLPLVDDGSGNFKLSPEQMEINRRGFEHVNEILRQLGRRPHFEGGHNEARGDT